MSLPYTVVARSDGRGGIVPFGFKAGSKEAKAFAGSYFHIGEGIKPIKITSDGRINIPKSVMDSIGIKNSDGKQVINIQFSTKAISKEARDSGKSHIDNIYGRITRPADSQKELKTREVAKERNVSGNRAEIHANDVIAETYNTNR